MVKKTEDNKNRIGIVAILGHVDHGKTTILDQIRKTNVQACEYGGITQKISAFTVCPQPENPSARISFIDTPGHEAFDLMRVRGGSIADVVLLIVAADDSVKPQTKESIEIIKKSHASAIVVINKCDLPNIDIEKVKRDITNEGLLLEGMGGNIPVVQVSGKTGQGIEDLLETINLVLEIEGIKRDSIPKSMEGKILGMGTVLESVKDDCTGCLSSIVNTAGKFVSRELIVFKSKNNVLATNIRGFITDDCKNIIELEDGQGGKVMGVGEILELGSTVLCVPKEMKKDAEKIYNEYIGLTKKIEEEQVVVEEEKKAQADEFWNNVFADKSNVVKIKSLNVIIKSPSEGSLEAIRKVLTRLDSKYREQNVSVNIVDASVGSVSQKDIDMAFNTKAIILGFQVDVMPVARQYNELKKVLVRTYNIIYELTEEVEASLEMLAGNDEIEEEIGTAEVKGIVTLSNGKNVVGGLVTNGVIKSNERCYILRGDDIIGKGRIVSLRHVKDEIKSASKGTDFGAIIDPSIENVQAGDTIFCYKVVAI